MSKFLRAPGASPESKNPLELAPWKFMEPWKPGMTHEEMARDSAETRRINDENYRAWKKRIHDINRVETCAEFCDRVSPGPDRKIRDTDKLMRMWEKRARQIYRTLCASE